MLFGVLFLLVLLQVGTVTAVLLSQWVRTSRALDQHSQQLLQDVVDETRENAQGFLGAAQSAVLLTEKLIGSGLLALSRPEELEHYFFDYLELVPQIDGLYFATPTGQFLFVKRVADATDARYVTKVIEIDGADREVRLLRRDATFQPISDRTDPSDSYDPRVRPWYVRAQASSGLEWSEPYVFFTSRKPGITAALRVVDEQGKLVGIVGADVELTALSDFLARQQVTSIGAAVIVNQHRDVLAYTYPDKILKPDGEKYRLARLNELDPLTERAAASLDQKYPELEALRTAEVGSFTSGDHRFLSVFVPFGEDRRWPWVMGVFAPEEHFAGPIRDGRRTSLLIGIAVSVLITVAAFLLSPAVTRPLTSLHQRATTDSLTGLNNRHSFEEFATRSVSEAQSGGGPLSALLVDIDFFKNINDKYGHQVGDEVLVAVAGRLGQALSGVDILGRVGGEEFAIVLPSTDLEAAARIAERLRACVDDPSVGSSVGPIPITVSVGVAELGSLGSTASLSALLDVADKRMLMAKRSGRNRVVSEDVPDA